mgnify:CR=1 FL=1
MGECKYCGLAKEEMISRDKMDTMFVKGKRLKVIVRFDGLRSCSTSFEANFCPMCGRELKE